MTSSRRSTPLVAGSLLAIALAACGTTVPQVTQLGSAAGTAAHTGTAGSDPTTGAPVTGGGLVTTPGAASVGAVTGAVGAAGQPGVPGAPVSAGGQIAAGAGTGATGRVPLTSGTKSAGTGKPSGTSAATAAPRSSTVAKASATAGVAGGAKVMTPLKVGIVYVNNSSTSSALGASVASGVSQKQAAEAIVRGINLAGGLNGRMIMPVEVPFNTDDSNYDSDAAAACQTFTQDSPVSVVLDTAFGSQGGFDSCLAKAGVLDIDTSDEGDAATSAASVLHVNTGQMNSDREYDAVISGLVGSGYLSKTDQIGIIVEGCPGNIATYNNAVVPLVAKLGLKKPVMAQLNCTTGFGSAGPAASAIANDIVTFRGDGVDRVMFISAEEEATALLLFAEAASAQQYKPGYLLSSVSEAGAVRSSLPSDQQPQLNGVGFYPTGDSEDPPAAAPAATRCLRYTTAAQVTPTNNNDLNYIFFECAPELLLDAALTATNGNSDAHALYDAINAMGTGFADPGVLGEASTFTTTRHDGPTWVQVFGYVTACSCIRYSGSPMTAPA